MKLSYFHNHSSLRLGLHLTDSKLIDVDAYLTDQRLPAFGLTPVTSDALPLLHEIAEKAGQAYQHSLNGLTFGPCVARPRKIICIGLNYRRHALESNMPVPTVPVVFTKYDNTLCDFGEAIPLGPVGEQFDYEVELGVVIGKRAKHVSRASALDYVLGYCVVNDLSCRDLQFRSSQWLMGKSLDKFSPLGATVVTTDEVGDPQSLQLRCFVNGQKRQDSSTADMVFSVAEIIEDLSRHFTLEPGDLILTGTPEGVAMGMPNKPWLRPGDVVRVEIERLGFSENRMV
jgi:2-keto-4-pentenoate hydratase/2-oxohepta-3-ene-1,7-dioic acid hydratase in catechol pathway